MDTTGTRDFVLYSEASLAQGVIVDHAPQACNRGLHWRKTMDHEISYIGKRSIDIEPLDKNQGAVSATVGR